MLEYVINANPVMFFRAVRLPWIFPGALLTVNGAWGDIRGSLTALVLSFSIVSV